MGKIVEAFNIQCADMHSYILQRSVHLFLRLTETSIILESFVFNSELLPVVRQRDAKHDGSRGTHLTISQENFLCYFILHVQVSQSEASESTLNNNKKKVTVMTPI